MEHRLDAEDERHCCCGRRFAAVRDAIVHQYEEVYLLGLSTGRAEVSAEPDDTLPEIPNSTGRIFRREPPRFARCREFSPGWLVLGMAEDVIPGKQAQVRVNGKEELTTVAVVELIAERIVKHRKGSQTTRFVLAKFEPVVQDG